MQHFVRWDIGIPEQTGQFRLYLQVGAKIDLPKRMGMTASLLLTPG
jgi:hypothetical protein